MLLDEDKITEIFFIADEFCKEYDKFIKRHALKPDDGKRHRNKPNRMSDAEVITILIAFHSSGMRTLKHFYLDYICVHCRHLFPKLLSYNRFTELEKEVGLELFLLLKLRLLGQCSSVNFVDSTVMRVCRNQRIHSHKVFKNLAKRGKHSMGWFYGFKLHIIINDRGEILNFMLTPGDVDDREPLRDRSFTEKIYGKLVGDKGYISKELFAELFVNGIQLITKLKNNMKNMLMSAAYKILLRKRAVIETVNDELKNIAQIEHSRHRSFNNFLSSTFAALAAYCFFPKKPSISLDFYDDNQLTIF